MSSTVEAWRLRAQMYRMVGERCTDCNEFIFPPRDVCPNCGSVNTGGDVIRRGIQDPTVLYQEQETAGGK